MENKHSKFLLVGVTTGLINTAHKLHNMGEKVADITIEAIISKPLEQKAVLAFSNPSTLDFMQRNPGLALMGMAATTGIVLGSTISYALKNMKRNENDSVSDKIIGLRNKFARGSNNSENSLRI